MATWQTQIEEIERKHYPQPDWEAQGRSEAAVAGIVIGMAFAAGFLLGMALWWFASR